ncbi:MAG: flippase-like domain-containing protein [Blastochloris sp.]|nr:flippase-like domain-containing protein [Blastochloris sp.]
MVETKRSGSLLSSWSFWIKLAVTAGILIWLVQSNDLKKLARELVNADPVWLILTFLCIGVAVLGTTLRWWFLLRVQGIHLPLKRAGALVMIGNFFNAFLPGSTGGDVVKIFYTIKQAPDRKARATLSILMDRILGLVAILCATFLVIPFKFQQISANAEASRYLLILLVLLGGVFLGSALVFLFPLKLLPTFFHKLWLKVPKRDVLESLYEGFQNHGRAGRESLSAVACAVFAVFFILGSGYCIARSLHLDVSYPLITVIFSLTLCAISLPISISGHGVREGMLILMFGIFAVTRQGVPVSQETAVAFSVIFLLISWVWALFGGAIYLGYSHQEKKVP